MTYQEIIKEWNDEVDKFNQWDSLGEDEKVEFAFRLGVSKNEKIKKLSDALSYAIKELECSGYCYDHPSLVKLRKLEVLI